MGTYNYKTDDPLIIEIAKAYITSRNTLVEKATEFCQKHSLGHFGFERCPVTWDIRFAGVSMNRSIWNKHYRELWYCPRNGFSSPRRHRKGEENSEIYMEYIKVCEFNVDGTALINALNGQNMFLSFPGIFFCSETLYVESPISLDKCTSLIEINQSELAQAKYQKEVASC